jgi:UDP-2,4-diacetamido-2,4,6-trideoxy-beta-L-altropyranose hydrolase
MQVVFRTDASLQIGTGHVMRCLTLADGLSKRGVQSTFICRPHSGHLLNLIRQRGYSMTALSPADDAFIAPLEPNHAKWLGTDWASDAQQTHQALGGNVVDWLVVDHYALSKQWEQALRPYTRRIMVIDDLADRPHDTDLLLDQNLGRMAQDYNGLLWPHTQTLIGPKYALLRPEFETWRAYSLKRRERAQLKNLLITMGGVDKDNVAGQVLQTLQSCELPKDLRITVVMGPHAPWLTQVQTLAALMPWPTQVLAGVSHMAQLMANSDLAIGAAGGTSWERCCLGLPTLLLVLADNQMVGAEALNKTGAALVLKIIHDIPQVFETLLSTTGPAQLKCMSDAAASVSDGLGMFRIVDSVFTERQHG